MTSKTDIWYAKPHQIEIAAECLPIITMHFIVYLAMEERTGKSITAIRIAEALPGVMDVLVITTKKALKGWAETLEKHPHVINIDTINYHSAKKIKKQYDLVILDEAHTNISGYPKTSGIWSSVAKLTKGVYIIYSSATPYAQGPQLLYHQFKLSTFNPFRNFKDFYAWFKHYAKRNKEGELPTKRINAGVTVMDYTAVKADEVIAAVEHLFISYTRKELGFEHEPEDVLHFIELNPVIKEIYNTLIKDKILNFSLAETGKDYILTCDSPSKLRWALHMLEGGTLKINDEYVNLGNNEKVEYILEHWGDVEDIAIMYHFKADAIKLGKFFSKATLLQATSNAEGIDLSGYKHLIIYSQDHSTAKHTQRRARQANMDRKEEIKVHYLLVKKAISEKAYKTVSKNKKNFVDTVFESI